MKRYLAAIALALLLSGCKEDSKPSEGLYVIDDIAVAFEQSADSENVKEQRSLQDSISRSIKALRNDIYFNYTPTQMDFYTAEGKHTAALEQGRVQINDVQHTLIVTGKESLRLVSDKKLACGFYDCEITLTLKKADDNNPALLKMKQQFAEIEETNKANLMRDKEAFSHLPQVDFPGQLFSLDENVTIKLPFKMAEGIKRWDSGFYVRHMGNIVIDKDQKDTLIYTYRERQSDINLDLLVVSAKKEDFDLTTWLSGSQGVLAQSERSAVYYNQFGNLETLHFQYDDVTKRYFFALANASKLAPLAELAAILRTMDADKRGEYLSMADLALSRQSLEEKSHLKVNETLDSAKIHQAIWNEIDAILQKPQRFIAQSQSLRPVRISVPSKTFRPDMYLAISSRSIPQLMAEVEKAHPQGKRCDDVFIYGDEGEETYHYFVNVGDGLVLHLAVPDDVGSLVERLMLLHVFRQLDVTRFPAIPAAERRNLFKYDSTGYTQSNPEDRFLVIGKTLVDRNGDRVIDSPSDGYFDYKYTPPFIIASKWKDVGDGNSIRQPDGFVFDEKGQLLLHAASLDSIAGQRWAIAGEGKTQGIYDLQTKKWIVKPQYDILRWYGGVFMAASASEEGSAVRQYRLLASDGRVLAEGSRIDEVEDNDRVIVIGNKNNVSLFSKKGALLFTRSGSELLYVPEIDGYGVLDHDPVSKENRVGIVSERGEIVFPVVYSGFESEGEYLEMQLPDGQPSRFYATDAVKNWRHQQPLQEVPAPK